MIEFFVPCIPPKTTAQQKGAAAMFDKTGRYVGLRHYIKKDVRQAGNMLWSLLQPHAPKEPLHGAVCLDVTFVWPWRKSEPQKNRVGLKPMIVRPDCSNLVKQIEDVLTGLAFWDDDAQIADLRVRKYWGDTPGIKVIVYNTY